MSLVKLQDIGKDYQTGDNVISPLINLNLEINDNDRLIIYGKSGSGKTTLLNILSTLEIPSNGSMIFADKLIESLSDKDLSNLRLNDIGVVFQSHHLLEEFSLHENIILPGAIDHNLDKDFANFLIEKLKISNRKDHLPDQLSGGERQGVVIARAMYFKSKVLILDEPTSALDVIVQSRVLNLLLDIKKKFDLTYIFITHDLSVVKNIANKVVVMNKGKIEETGETIEIFQNPKSEYTKTLIRAIPTVTDEEDAAKP